MTKIIFYILLLLFIGHIKTITCPSNCSCETATFSCQVCLEYYLQVYSIQTKGCQCLPGFELTSQVVDYCHPINCKQANDWGCATCYPNAIIIYQQQYQYYNCSCIGNYYLNLTSNLCDCLSKKQPTKYYEDTVLEQCLKCPNNCVCNEQGCIQCQEGAMRNVIKNEYSSTCYCKKPHLEVNGSCKCAPNCTCYSNGTTVCNPSSNRKLVVDQWICRHPYVQYNGQCSCISPYTIVRTLGYDECVCSSKVNYTYYYEINGTCYKCGLNCTCDHTGCISCFDGSVYLNYELCACRKNYVYQQPNCLCLDPFELYTDPNSGDTSCRCLNYRLSEYYSNGDFCDKCPSGCTCNSTGCFSCYDPLRTYIKKGQFTMCQCSQNSVQLQGKCVCTSLFIFNSSTNSCQCKNIPQQTFYDSETKICKICPIGCLCNSTGCFSCVDQAYRTIKNNSHSISTCYCMAQFVQIDGLCLCPHGYSLANGNCQCQDPYYLDENNTCSCKDKINNTLYYYDDFQLKCRYCPPGCICNISGCIDCGSDFLRTIKYSLITFKYRCPCLQNSFLVGGYCTVCNNNSYPEYLGSVKNISCVKCIECKTCNRYGCLSCNQNMTLVNKQCVCDDSTLINQNGRCQCPHSQYLSSGVCKECPLNCNSCTQINGIISCSSCALNINRMNFPAEGCPCQTSYKQSVPSQAFCCSILCDTCINGLCETCPQNTYRTLSNGQCLCENGFVAQNHTLTCNCPSGRYLLNDMCFKCPVQCLTCGYDADLLVIVCLSCSDYVNRNTTDQNCSCNKYFSQTANFKSTYCYATYCQQTTINCSNCIKPWQIDKQRGYCVCQKGNWVNSENICIACTIDGCLNCLNQLVCVECNETDNFYLVQTFCSEVNTFEFLAVRSMDRQLILQFWISGGYESLEQVSVTVNPIMAANPLLLEQQLQLELLTKKLLNNGTLLSLILDNVNMTYSNIIVSTVIQVSNISDITDEQQQQITLKYNMKMPILYSNQTFQQLQQLTRIGLFVLVVLVIFITFGFYLFGFKHNQACFFMQTMSFACFGLKDPSLSTAIFLYNLRYSYYNFSPNNALSTIVPADYIERSIGNYKYLTTDANIVRNIGLPITFAIIIAGLALFFRFFYEVTKNRSIIQPAGLAIFWKKMIYRTIEFFYKTLMYPLIFFSIQNLFNWNTDVYVDAYFKRHCSIASIIIISIYFIITLYQFFFQLISRMNKYQNLKQFLNASIGSLILIGFQSNPKIILLFIIIFFVNQLPFYRYKIQDIIFFKILDIIRFIIVLLQIICIILVYYITKTPLIVLFCITLLIQMGLLVYKAIVDKHYNMISKLTSYSLNEQQDDDSNVQSQDFVLEGKI